MGSGDPTWMIQSSTMNGKAAEPGSSPTASPGESIMGFLDRERFLPVAKKGGRHWPSVVNEDGQVGWSQPAGGGPGKVAEADTSKFGTGIFLLAASEIYLLTQ